MIIEITVGTISFIYSSLILWIYRGWKLSQSPITTSISPHIGISVIIPVRNEANNIADCIQSILLNEFPKTHYEILVIDDHSTDNTKECVLSLIDSNIHYFSLNKDITGKKHAITYGVHHAKFPLILCTDGDSRVGKKWLQTHSEAYENSDIQFCAGTVLPETGNTLINNFQWLDFISMMAVTANGIYRKAYFLANGANMSYRKSAFLDHRGFEGNFDRASGDDIYLIQKITGNNKGAATFLSSKDAIVTTKSEKTWKSFFNQRKRWASKAINSFDHTVKAVQGFIFVFTLLIMLLIPLTLLYPNLFLKSLLCGWMVKIIVDYIFLMKLAYYYENRKVIKWFLPSFFIYNIHILLSGFYALFPPEYEWKHRKVK